MAAPGGGSGGSAPQVYQSIFEAVDNTSATLNRINTAWRAHLGVLREAALAENNNAEGIARVNQIHQNAVAAYNAADRAALGLTATENQLAKAMQNQLIAEEASLVAVARAPVMRDRAAQAARSEAAALVTLNKAKLSDGETSIAAGEAQVLYDEAKRRTILANAEAAKSIEAVSAAKVAELATNDAVIRSDLARGQALDVLDKKLADARIKEMDLERAGAARATVNTQLINAQRMVVAGETQLAAAADRTSIAYNNVATARRTVAAAEADYNRAVATAALPGGTPTEQAQQSLNVARAREVLTRAKEVEASKTLALAAAERVEAQASLDVARAKEVEALANTAASAATKTAAADAVIMAEGQLMVADGALIAARNLHEEAIGFTDVAVQQRIAAKGALEYAAANEIGGKSALTTAEKQALMGASMTAGARGLGGMAIGMGDMLGASAPLIAGIAVLTAGVYKSAEAYIHWQDTMVTLQNNIAITDQSLKEMDATVRGVAVNTGGAFDDLAEGERRILDYAFAASESSVILQQTSEAAVSTGAKTADVAQAVAQALHQYGLSAYDAAQYTNVLLINAQRANFSMEEFSQSTKRATGIAAELHVPYDQVVSALSALTRVYGSATEAQTQVVNIMRYLLHPTAEQADAWDALAEKTGHAELASSQLATTLSTQGLTGILTSLTEAYHQMGLSTQEVGTQTLSLMNSQRGGFGLLTLLTGAAEDYRGNLAASADVIEGRVNPVNEAYARTQATLANQLDVMKNGVINAAIEFGESLAPALTDVLGIVNDLLQSFGSLLSLLKLVGPVLDLVLDGVASYIDPTRLYREELEKAANAVVKVQQAEAARLEAKSLAPDGDRFGFTGDQASAVQLAQDAYEALGQGADKLNEQQHALVAAYVLGNQRIEASSGQVAQAVENNVTKQYTALDVYARRVMDNTAQLTNNGKQYDQELAQILAVETQQRFAALSSAEQVEARTKALQDAGIVRENMTAREKLDALEKYVSQYASAALDIDASNLDITGKQTAMFVAADATLGAALEMVRQYREELSKGIPEDTGTRPRKEGDTQTFKNDFGVETAKEQADRLKGIYDDIQRTAERKSMGVLQALEQERVETKQKLDDMNAAMAAAQQIGGGFGAAMVANYSKMAQAAQLSLGDIDKAIAGLSSADLFSSVEDQVKQLADILAKDGPDAAQAYAQGLLAQLQTLPTDVQAQIQPIMDYLQEVATNMANYGMDGGDGFGMNVNNMLNAWIDPVQSILGDYSSAADMRTLFANLGIETGDNYGQKVRDRLNAWYAPIKAQVDAYLALLEVLAGTMRRTAATMATMSPTMAPGAANVFIPLTEGAAALESQIKKDRQDVKDLKAEVFGQGEKNIQEHEDAQAKKAKKASDSAAEKAQRAREQALAAMQAVADNIALGAAADDVAKAMKNAADSTEFYKNLLNGLKATLKEAQDELKNMAEVSEGKIHAMNVELHNAEAQLKIMEGESAKALKPLQDDIDKANLKLKDLQATAARVREVWQDQRDVLNDSMADINSRAKSELDPINMAIQALSDQLYDLGQAAKAALTPLDDAIYDQNKVMKGLRDNADALAATYDAKLIPLQKELAALKLLDEKDTRAKTLDDMAQSVGNLDARIRNAVVGSKQYNELVKQRNDSMNKLNRTQKEYSLEDQIKAIEAAKQAAVEAADAQIKAQQKVLDQMVTEREEVRRSFELQQRALQDQLDAQQRLADLTERKYTAERELLQGQIDLLTRQQELYDRQERDKETAAQDAINQAQDAYDKEKIFQDARQALTRAYILNLQDLVKQEQWNEGETERIKNKEIGGINEIITAVGEQKTKDDEANLAIITGAKDAQTALQDTITTRKEAVAQADALAQYAKAFNTDMGAASSKLIELTPKWERFAPATTAAANSLKDDLIPAVQNVATKIVDPLDAVGDEWGKIFGIGSPPGKIVDMLFNRDQNKGFFAWTANKLILAMGETGLKGTMEQQLTFFFDMVAGKFTEEKPTVDLSLKNFGIYLLDGIGVGLADEIARKRLAANITSAVNAAITEAEANLKINSPSGVTRDRLGRPLGEGIIVGAIEELAGLGNALSDGMMRADVDADYRKKKAEAEGGYRVNVGGYASFGAGNIGGDIHVHLENLSFVLPGVKRMSDLSNMPNDWDPYARAIVLSIADYTRRMGLNDPFKAPTRRS